MAYRQEELVAEIVEQAGLMSRRRLSDKSDPNSWRAGRRGSARPGASTAEPQPKGTS
jgi:hypothetical protein